MLEHRAADHCTQTLTAQTEPVDQPAQGGGEHVLVGRLGVGTVGTRERDSITSEHRDAAHGNLSEVTLISVS